MRQPLHGDRRADGGVARNIDGRFRNMSEDGDHVRYQIYCVELARSFDPDFRTRTMASCGD